MYKEKCSLFLETHDKALPPNVVFECSLGKYNKLLFQTFLMVIHLYSEVCKNLNLPGGQGYAC
jgi:hypothetical protein